MKVFFMGTPDFAVSILDAVKNAGYEVVGAFSQPDKPKGRGHKLQPTPVKEYCVNNGIPIYQPLKMRDGSALEIIKESGADTIVVAAYGRILPKEIIDYPKYGCINVHGSLLPKYRGAAPIQWAVINGEKETGITSMHMDEGLDTGNILLKTVTEIGEHETAGELFIRLAQLGKENIVKTLEMIESGAMEETAQDEKLSSYAPLIEKSMAKLYFDRLDGCQADCLVRGMNPFPSAFVMFEGKKLKVHASIPTDEDCGDIPGRAVRHDPEKGLLIACRKGGIYLKEVQLEGSNRMSIHDFIRGHRTVTDYTFIWEEE